MLECVLPKLFPYKIVTSSVESAEKFKCEIRIALNNEEEFMNWKKDFERNTNSSWTVYRSKSAEKSRLRFCRKYVCHHSSHRKKKGCSKDKNCLASMLVHLKQDTKYVRCRDPFAKEGYFGIIKINFMHSHEMNNAEALKWLPKSDETKKIFLELFNSGMTPAAAKNYHESLLSTDSPELLTNSRINPPARWIYSIYEKWQKENLGGLNSGSNFMRQRAAAAEEEAKRLSEGVQIKQEIIDEWGESIRTVAGSTSPLHVRLDIQVEKDKNEEWLERQNRNSTPAEILPTIAGTSSSYANLPFHESTENSQDIVLGRRSIDMNFFLNQIRNLNSHSPFNCSFSDMIITSEIREGLNTGLVFTCKKCKCEEIVWTENPKIETATSEDTTEIERMNIGEDSSNLEDCPTNPEILSLSSNSSKDVQNEVKDVSRKKNDLEKKNASLEKKRLAVDNEANDYGLTFTCKICKHRETIRTENHKIETVTINKDYVMEMMSTEEESCNLKERPIISEILPLDSSTNKIVKGGINEACTKTEELAKKNTKLKENRLAVKNGETEAVGLVYICKVCKHKEIIRTEKQEIGTVASKKYTMIDAKSIRKECSSLEKCISESETSPLSSNPNTVAQDGIHEACPHTVDFERINAGLVEKRSDVEKENIGGGSLVFICKMCKHKETIWTDHKNTETGANNKTAVIETMNIDGEHFNSEKRLTNLGSSPLSSSTHETVQHVTKNYCQRTTDLERKNTTVLEDQSAMEEGDIRADGIPSSSDGC